MAEIQCCLCCACAFSQLTAPHARSSCSPRSIDCLFSFAGHPIQSSCVPCFSSSLLAHAISLPGCASLLRRFATSQSLPRRLQSALAESNPLLPPGSNSFEATTNRQPSNMDAPEPEQTPFAAVTAHTTRLQRVRLRGLWLNLRCWPVLLTVASITKRSWTSQLRMLCTDGLAPAWPWLSSSCASSSRKDGTLVSAAWPEKAIKKFDTD